MTRTFTQKLAASGKRLADGLFNRRGDWIEAATEKRKMTLDILTAQFQDRYGNAKLRAASITPGRYTMKWQVGKGSLRGTPDRPVVIENRRGINCFCYAEDVGKPQELFSPVELAMRVGTTFTPENNDVPTQNASGDLLSQLCTVDYVGVHSLG